MDRSANARLPGQSKRNRFPEFYAVFVGFLGELRDSKVAMLIND